MKPLDLIVYTTEQGGIMKAIRGTREQYERAAEIGILRIERPDLEPPERQAIRVDLVAWAPAHSYVRHDL